MNNKSRCVKVRFSDDSELITSMAAHLTDEEINAYFQPGKVFNVGPGEFDKMAKVTHTEIIK